MNRKDIVIKVNSNFHHVAGYDLYDKKDPVFKTYRKKWKEWPENFHAGDFPLFIDIEVTSLCNLECPFCATTFNKKNIKQGYISFEAVKKIIDEGAGNGLYGVKFNLRGEPLLHPDIVEFVKYAKRKGLMDVYFNTNGMLLTEDISKRLIDAGLDRISISIEGHTKKIYEKYRVGGIFEKVILNIEGMQNLKKKLGVNHPKLRIQTVMLKDLTDDFDEYKKFWENKADEVAFLDYKRMKDKRKTIEYGWACPQVWQRMAVWWDGTILPCNHDDDGLLSLGNVKTTSIKQAWLSEKLNETRDVHKKGLAHKIQACDGCYLRDSEIHKLMKRRML